MVLCVREIQRNLGESAQPLLRNLIREFGWSGKFDVQRDRIVGRNGSEIWFRGLSDSHGTARRVRSLEGVDLTWVEEAEDVSEEALDQLLPTVLRKPSSHVIFTLNPREPDGAVYRRYVAGAGEDAVAGGVQSDVVVEQINYDRNPWFPERLDVQRRWYEQNKPSSYGHIWLGEPRIEVEGALWSQAMLAAARMSSAEFDALPDADNVVVGVDPAGTSGTRSDYTGIVVMARIGRAGYVLASERLKATPAEWGKRALALRAEYGASRVVVEVSGAGADSLLHTVRTLDGSVRVEGVSASGLGSKWERASPLATLTELGRLWLVGRHADLESEMLAFTLDSKRDDLVDAAVWCGRGLGVIGRRQRNAAQLDELFRERGL